MNPEPRRGGGRGSCVSSKPPETPGSHMNKFISVYCHRSPRIGRDYRRDFIPVLVRTTPHWVRRKCFGVGTVGQSPKTRLGCPRKVDSTATSPSLSKRDYLVCTPLYSRVHTTFLLGVGRSGWSISPLQSRRLGRGVGWGSVCVTTVSGVPQW